ncbi:hypothetical protein [Yinghuangia seranimata]|uniref:hypothetical protein n=1 Tax=Yinghuangia seranimata TaxID=408067 RepID=UPI00248CF4FC|nr:hypothetical protein [Yinghuangia seranimata]MDI2132553.1 hypothetical protein [Yinghuangia seranimata]
MAVRRHRIAPRRDPELAAALHAIDDFSRWIENADTKAAHLVAILGTLAAGLLSQSARVSATWHYAAVGNPTPAVLLTIVLILLSAALIEVALALLPNTTPSGPTRLAFPWMAQQSGDMAGSTIQTREAWSHAQFISRRARAKLGHVRRAVGATAASSVLFIAWWVVILTLDTHQ